MLGLLLVLVAGAVGARAASAAVAFGAAAVIATVFVLQDPRRRPLGRALGQVPERPSTELPPGAVVESSAQMIRGMLFPSTIGLTLLAAVALAAGRPVLAAILAGCLAGLGVAALARGGLLLAEERRRGVALLADRRTRRLYERPL